MRKVKWIFFGYLGFVALIIAFIGISFATTPLRDSESIYLIYNGSIKSLDPAEVNDTVGALLIGQLYECLYNYRYGVRPYEVFPELAAAMPEVSADGLTMTIKLRHGIHFYDPEKLAFPQGEGPEMKASDVVFSFKRMCDFNLASPNYSANFEGEIVGLDDWWKYTESLTATPDKVDWDRPVEGFKALDDYTVQIKFTQPDPQMVYKLAHEPTGIVSRQAVTYWKTQFRKHPVATGPYMITENEREQRIVMVANPVFRGKQDADGGTVVPEAERLPHIKRIEWEYADEQLPPWLKFQQGLLDVAGIPKDSFRTAISIDSGQLTPDMQRKGVQLTKLPEAATEYIGFNMQDPVVGKNKPLRQAMSLAFDRETYIRNFINGRAQPAIGPIPPGFPTYDPKRFNPYAQFNLALAREKLIEAEKINGGPIPPMTILMRDADTLARQMAENFVGQMKQIGLTVTPEFRDWARWQQRVDNRQTQLFDSGWVADYPDEQNFLQLFYGKFAPAGGVNSTAYVNPAFDTLYEKAVVMPDTPERRKLYRQMEDIAMEDCSWLVQMYPVIYRLSYDWIGNRHDMDYGYGTRAQWTLDSALRTKKLASWK
jgi:ABC-type transport system substrate-binding protein